MNDVGRAAFSIVLTCGFLRATDRQSTFDFHSNFWVNLHHFIYEQAAAKTPEPSDSPDWQAALDLYRREIVKSELLSRDIAGINSSLSHVENTQSLKGSEVSGDLAGVLEKAAVVYKARWWPQHNRANLAWIDAAIPLVAKYEGALKKELAGAYQTGWPSERIRTDVAEYASRMGAYTMLEPTHITISRTDPGNQGPAALETLFHEASHAMIQKVSEALSAELDSQNKLFQRRAVWHAVLFYTTGELARRHLGDYTQYATKNGVFERGWPGLLPILEKDWKPYLDGEIDLATAAHRLVEDYGVPRPAKR